MKKDNDFSRQRFSVENTLISLQLKVKTMNIIQIYKFTYESPVKIYSIGRYYTNKGFLLCQLALHGFSSAKNPCKQCAMRGRT